MISLFEKNVFRHPIILGSFAFVIFTALGSGAYYYQATSAPRDTPHIDDTTILQNITSTGIVEPAQNPDLAFETSGRVTHIDVVVGQPISQGQLLASVDTSALVASRAQAAASQKAEQATLDAMNVGARQVDVDAKQTARDIASQTLANDYVNALDVTRDSYGKAYGAIHTYSDSLFSNPDSASPSLVFQSSNSQNVNDLVSNRVVVGNELATWKQEISTLSDDSSSSDRVEALTRANAHLDVLRAYGNQLLETLTNAVPSTNFNSVSIAGAYTSANALRDLVGALISVTQNQSQRIKNDTLAVQSATAALHQITAPATTQDIAAQEARVEAAAAQVAAANAQIAKAIIVAPFDGTVASIHANVGDIVAANTSAISLSPKSALQVHAYVSAKDAVSISVGARSMITLDAYGTHRVFPATVTIVDHAPTMQNGVPAYKITLQFDQDDPAIGIGMNANVTIPITH